MAEIAPVRGLIYNPEKLSDLSKLVSPPYDVVSEEEQAGYHQAHPNNVMHLILGARHPEDEHEYDWHKRAAEAFARWRKEEILIRHDRPAIYYTETDFIDPTNGRSKTRGGFMCLLKLEDFGARAKVRPHERTFSATRAERLDLMINVKANLSQIFTVYPDPAGESRDILQAGVDGAPIFDFIDNQDRGHRLWPIYDRSVIKRLSEFMLDKTVYIADGHHRYETSLNYRRFMTENGTKPAPRSPLNYTLVFLCATSDPGLTILPAHRLIKNSVNLTLDEMEKGLKRFFEIERFPFSQADEPAVRKTFISKLKQDGSDTNAIGLYTGMDRAYYLVKKRNEAHTGTALDSWPEPLRGIDTVVLTGLVIRETLGLTEKDLDDPQKITYTSLADEAIARVDKGRVEVACILNPTRMDQVQLAAEQGLVMPRKSTYFFPKVITGLIFNSINPSEEIETFV